MVHVSTYQSSILGTGFLSHSHMDCCLPQIRRGAPLRCQLREARAHEALGEEGPESGTAMSMNPRDKAPRPNRRGKKMRTTLCFAFFQPTTRNEQNPPPKKKNKYSVTTEGMVADNFVVCSPLLKMNRTNKRNKTKHVPRTKK